VANVVLLIIPGSVPVQIVVAVLAVTLPGAMVLLIEKATVKGSLTHPLACVSVRKKLVTVGEAGEEETAGETSGSLVGLNVVPV
jgi:hypothetical protein